MGDLKRKKILWNSLFDLEYLFCMLIKNAMNKFTIVLFIAILTVIATKSQPIVINNYGTINGSDLVEQKQATNKSNKLLNNWNVNMTFNK